MYFHEIKLHYRYVLEAHLGAGQGTAFSSKKRSVRIFGMNKNEIEGKCLLWLELPGFPPG